MDHAVEVPEAGVDYCLRGVAHLRAIDDDGEVMKTGAWMLSGKSRSHPALLYVGFLAEPEIDSHLRCVGRLKKRIWIRGLLSTCGKLGAPERWTRPVEIARGLSKAKARTQPHRDNHYSHHAPAISKGFRANPAD
jgi:hypothetical protein